jgi:PiT family inorganic phosphate transporter
VVDLATGKPVARRPNLDQGMNVAGLATFGGLLASGLIFTAYSLYRDISAAGSPAHEAFLPFHFSAWRS